MEATTKSPTVHILHVNSENIFISEDVQSLIFWQIIIELDEMIYTTLISLQ